jgi:UDP-N-acetylenolpyruvoylglucosamine reductase
VDLDGLSRSLHARFDTKTAAREKALPASRRSIRASANAIRAVHRLEFDRAQELIAESREAIDEGLSAVADELGISRMPVRDALRRLEGDGVVTIFANRGASIAEYSYSEVIELTENPQELTKRMQKYWIVKKAAQPLGHQSAGCIFKNPRGLSAGALIDQAGLKGMRVGGAALGSSRGPA